MNAGYFPGNARPLSLARNLQSHFRRDCIPHAMATLTHQSSAPLLADPHGILCFIDQMQRECPDAPRSRIAEALFEAKGIPAVSSTPKSLKAFVRARLGARNYLKPIRPSV